MAKDETLLQKLFYAGIGLAYETKESLQKKIDELVEKNKLTKEEGKKILDDFVNKFEEKKEEYEKKLKDFIRKTVEDFKFVKRKDFEELQERVKALEDKLKDE